MKSALAVQPLDPVVAPPVVQLISPQGSFDSGDNMVKLDINGAVNNMIVNECTLEVFHRRVLQSVLMNIWRRNQKRKRGAPELRTWSMQTEKGKDKDHGKWVICLRKPGESFSPFPKSNSPVAEKWGKWLPFTERLIEGETVEIDPTLAAFKALGQSFRSACSKRGYKLPPGKVLAKTVSEENGRWLVRVVETIKKG